ncbi:unnamed protein product, partial [Closterium sp. NIES-54]
MSSFACRVRFSILSCVERLACRRCVYGSMVSPCTTPAAPPPPAPPLRGPYAAPTPPLPRPLMRPLTWPPALPLPWHLMRPLRRPFTARPGPVPDAAPMRPLGPDPVPDLPRPRPCPGPVAALSRTLLGPDLSRPCSGPDPVPTSRLCPCPTLLTFDAEGRAVAFDVWLDDLQLFLQCDSRDGLSLFDLTSGASTAPAADADSTVRSQWLTHDAAARLAVRSHLPPTERAHFSQYKSAKTLYDAVTARYSSPATAALSRLMLPYLFPDLAAFATVTDLITHLRASDTRYRAALPA